MDELVFQGAPRPERADAARNRTRILAAAEALFAERGVAAVSMDDVAQAAGVGKGTLYRRFGDKAGLGVSILDARERDLQEAILHGPPPLGPGAPPRERAHAFVDAYLDYLERNLELLVMCETAAPGARYRSGVYLGWQRYLAVLFDGIGFGDAQIRAHLVLAMLDADLHRFLVTEQGVMPSAARATVQAMLREGVAAVAGALTEVE